MAKTPTPKATPAPTPTPTPTPTAGSEQQAPETASNDDSVVETGTTEQASSSDPATTEGTVEETPAVAPVVEQTPAPTPAAPPPPPAEPKVVVSPTPVVASDPTPETVTSASTDPVAQDDPQVAELKTMLADFKTAISKPGKKPEDFKAAAKLAAQFTRYVVQFPKVPVLDALLAFFEENADGVCQANVYMKGSNTLPPADNQQVGYLYSLFMDLTRKQDVPINSALVVQVLKKIEFSNYYSRKIAAIRAKAAAAA